MTISSEIIKFASSRTSSFTKKELLEFLKASTEDVSAGTVHVLLNRLVESGKLAKVGRGLFSLSDNIKPPYVYIPNNIEDEMSATLKRMFPFVTYCVWKANAITPFMQHIPSMSFVLVDVERIAMEAVFQHLQGQYPESMILLNPSQSDCDRYLNMDNIIVVRPLIAEAPLSTYQGVNTPSIEKILVDIVSDNVFDYAGGAELYHIYNNVFESVDVNEKKLLRYASRRNRKERIEQILKSNNLWYIQIADHLLGFKKFAAVELAYRNLPTDDIQQVLDDIFNTSLSMTIQGTGDPEEYKLLVDGMKRVKGFIHSEKYGLEGAIINASKAAYLSKIIEKGSTEVYHFNPDNTSDLIDTEIIAPLPSKLNRLKKTNIEAFYYWSEVQKLIQ